MSDMKFKENCGVDPVTLGKGFTRLDGNPPNSGESITDPRHVAEEEKLEAIREEFGWPDEKADDDGPEGFLDRDKPTPYDRPNRSTDNDLG